MWLRHKPLVKSVACLWLAPRNAVENYGKLIDFCDDSKPCLTSFQRMFVANTSDGGDLEEGEVCQGIQMYWPDFPTNCRLP